MRCGADARALLFAALAHSRSSGAVRPLPECARIYLAPVMRAPLHASLGCRCVSDKAFPERYVCTHTSCGPAETRTWSHSVHSTPGPPLLLNVPLIETARGRRLAVRRLRVVPDSGVGLDSRAVVDTEGLLYPPDLGWKSAWPRRRRASGYFWPRVLAKHLRASCFSRPRHIVAATSRKVKDSSQRNGTLLRMHICNFLRVTSCV